MQYRHGDQQQQRQQLLTLADRGTTEQLFTFLQAFHRRPFQNANDVLGYEGTIDDQIDFIDCTGTRYSVTPLIIAAGKGSLEKAKILLVHGANPNKQCATGDTALNLAAHRQKYPIVDLLLHYKANPNLFNQAGKTALHRAVVSYSDENANRIRTLLEAGADPRIEDRNQRIPLDEAVVANRAEVVDILLSYDRTLIDCSYRAAITAARLGHDKCLETLLNYGMDPNIVDQTKTTPLHVAVRSMKLPTVRLLIANGADPNIANNRGETAMTLAERLQPDQQRNFVNILLQKSQMALSDGHSYKAGNAIYVYPLLRGHPNWTLDSDEFRSSTADNSSVQNLIDASIGTYWCCTQTNNAWVIFDLKYEYNITGVRIIGCDNRSTPKDVRLDVSNALNGPWLKVKDFTCLITQGNKNDFFFPALRTRFIRVCILTNYGGEDIRIQGIGFFGVDMRLVNLLKEYGLEKSLNTLLANGINDQETLYENQDEILNSSDKYLHLNDHFQFIRLTQSLKSPQLTFLEWFIVPQTTVIAGVKLPTFSVAADEGLTDRVKLEEQLETSPQATTVLMRDLEPIQGRSLVDFPDYTIKQPGRYRIRVVSLESPHIHTSWQAIVVGPTSPYSRRLNYEGDEHLYLSSTTHLSHDTTSDKENALLAQKNSTTTAFNKDNRAFVAEVYESELDDTQLISIKSIENSPYDFSLTNMSHTTDSSLVNYRPGHPYKPEHYTQTRKKDFYDHSTNTIDDFDEGYDSSSRLNPKSTSQICLTPTKYRSESRTPLSNIFLYSSSNSQKQYDDDDNVNYGDKIIIPTKYRLRQERINQLLNNENSNYSQQLTQSPVKRQDQYEQRQSQNGDSSSQQQKHQSRYQQRHEPPKRTQSVEEPASPKQQQKSHYQPKHQSQQRNGSSRESSPDKIQSHYSQSNQSQKPIESKEGSPSQGQQQQLSRKHSDSEDESLLPHHRQEEVQNQNPRVPNLVPPEQLSHHESRRPQSGVVTESSPPQQEQESNYYELEVTPKRNGLVRESSPPQLQSAKKRTDPGTESLEEQSQYFGQEPVRNVSPLQPPKRQPTYVSREQARPRSESPPQEGQESNYYELELSPERNKPLREPSPAQRRTPRKRIDSGDESEQEQSEYYGQAPLQNRNTPMLNVSPPTKQVSIYERKAQPGQRIESPNRGSPLPQQQPSNYYEIDQSPKHSPPTRQTTVRQHQSPYRDQQQQQRTPPSTQIKQQVHQRNGSGHDSTYYDQRLDTRTTVDDESTRPHYQQHHISIGNIDQDNLKPLYNRYKIIGGDFELRESPSNESKSGEIQLVFKATLQGHRVQERAKDSLREIVTDRNRSPPNDPSPINADRRNQNSTNIVSQHEADHQEGSKHDSRLNSVSQTAQSTPERDNRRHDKHTNKEDNPTLLPSPSPNAFRRQYSKLNHSPATDANHPDNDQLPADNQTASPYIKIQDENEDDLDGIHERSRSASSTHSPSKYEKLPLKPADHARTSSSSLTPAKVSPHQSKYYFGENVQSPVSDDDSDGADCEMFGHNPSPRPQANTTTRRNLDYSSIINPRLPLPPSNNNTLANSQFTQQTEIGTTTENNRTTQPPRSASPTQLTGSGTGGTIISPEHTNRQTALQADREASDYYPNTTNYIDLNQNASHITSPTVGFPQQQNYAENDHYEKKSANNMRREQQPPPPSSKFHPYKNDDRQTQGEEDEDDEDPADEDDDDYQDEEDDVPNPVQNNRGDRNYTNEADYEDDNLSRDNESHRSSLPQATGVNQLLRQNPVRDVPTSYQPSQYSPNPLPALPQPRVDNSRQGSKKPLEITVRTADHSPPFTSGIIPPKLPSTPTTDSTDEIDEREPFERIQTNRYTPPPYRPDSRDNNDEDTEESDSMSELRPHNSEHQARLKELREFGTQVDERSTRTIGTMSDPIKTRNAGNEVQPQSSATQTPNLLQLQQQYDKDGIDFTQPTSQRLRDDTKTNGHYPSHRSTSLDHRNNYVPSGSLPPQHRDHSDYDQPRPRHRSHYHDDPRSQNITERDYYHPHSSSRTRRRIPSPTHVHGTPPPPAPYRTHSPTDRYRFPSVHRSHSRSPPSRKHIQTSTNNHASSSPASQRRSRSPQRSISPPLSKHQISMSSHHTPSPPPQYRSKIPDDRQPPLSSPPKDYSHRPKMVSAGTDTSLDGIKSSKHRDRSPTSNYQKLDANPLKCPNFTQTEPFEDGYKVVRDIQPPSTRKSYRLRPDRNDSNTNNYDDIPSKHNESISSPLNRSFDRPREYTPKLHPDDRRRQASPSPSQKSIRDEQYPTTHFTDVLPNETYLRELPKGGSVSIPSTTVFQPDTLPRFRQQNKSSTHRNSSDRSRQAPQLSLHRAQEQQTPPERNARLLNFGTSSITHQPSLNEVATPFSIRYVQEDEEEFSTDNSNIRSSTLKRDHLRSKSNRMLLLPVLNSSRTYVFEKQPLNGHHLRQSRSNGNFYLATSPTLQQFDSAYVDDADQLTEHTLRSQVA